MGKGFISVADIAAWTSQTSSNAVKDEGEAEQMEMGGCGGTGRFELDLPVQWERPPVGPIPAGTVELVINLAATSDLDINLYDTEDTSVFPEGRAIVSYCSEAELLDESVNCGLIGSALGVETLTYKGVEIEYSGYMGVDKNVGVEYITVTGATPSTFEMKAFAYEVGKANVTYTWGNPMNTACCLGVPNTCGGEFNAPILIGDIYELGKVPAGKGDLSLKLKATSDLDLRIYDLDQTDQHADGAAIVAWCDPLPCNWGAITDVDGAPSFMEYEGLMIDYSGYLGEDATGGSETIQVHGTTNHELNMLVYAYEAGSAVVTYTYTEGSNVEERCAWNEGATGTCPGNAAPGTTFTTWAGCKKVCEEEETCTSFLFAKAPLVSNGVTLNCFPKTDCSKFNPKKSGIFVAYPKNCAAVRCAENDGASGVCPGNPAPGTTLTTWTGCKKICQEEELCTSFLFAEEALESNGVKLNCFPKADCSNFMERPNGVFIAYPQTCEAM